MDEQKSALRTKSERRAALPARLRVGCWLVVVPIFIVSIVLGVQAGASWWYGIAALVLQGLGVCLYAWFEIESVRWLKANGHF